MGRKFRWTPGWERHLARRSEDLLQGLAPRMESEAYRLAPILTGELRESIQATVGQDGRGVRLVLAAGVGGLAPYAPYVELGTSRMRAQPYLRPAAMRRWL